MTEKSRDQVRAQYAAGAQDWSGQYADAASYLSHRAELVVSLGPRLEPGDRVLDLACGDGALAAFLPGLEYLGVDASAEMVDEARRHGVAAELGDLNEFAPAAPVDATCVFRAIYYASDRAAFFRHVAGYTERKLVFDLNPRQYRLEDVRADLHAAGLTRLEVRPFFVPQTVALPRAAVTALRAAERSGPAARLALRYRFTYLCAASSHSALPRSRSS
jgi:SAM-dependent methyltransferase